MTIDIFMFHEICDPPFTYPKRFESKSFLRISTFLERLEYIQKHYQIISINDIDKVINKKEKYAILTFDDGTIDNYTVTFPILEKKNIPATFFIPTDCCINQNVMDTNKIQYIIGSFNSSDDLVGIIKDKLEKYTDETFSNLWDKYSVSLWENNWWSSNDIFITRLLREGFTLELRKKFIQELYSEYVSIDSQLYMNIDQIKEINQNELFTIGGHGHYSYNLSLVNDLIIDQEILESKNFLKNLGVKDLYFAYPNGGYNSKVIKALETNGFKYAFTTIQETLREISNPFILPRFDGSQHTFKQKIVICGVQQQGLDIYNFLMNNNINVTHIITIDEKEAKKQKASGWIDYTKSVDQYKTKIYHVKNYSFKTEEDFEYFHRERFDILLLGGWQRIIPNKILKLIKHGCIGQHGSSDFLPKYRGRSPLNWSIILGKKRLIWNIFFLKAGVDDGDIIDFEIFDINEWDDCKTMYYKVSIAVKYMLLKNIPLILSDKIKLIKQTGEPSYYGKRTPDDGIILWNKSMYEIHRLIRGVTRPYPGAFTYKGDEKIYIWKAQPFSANLPFYIDKKYGEIVEVFDSKTYLVKAEEGLLLITESTDINPCLGDVYH